MPRSYGLFLEGKWSDGAKGQVLESRSPATRKLLATFRKGTRKDVADAVGVAQAAAGAWRRTPAPKRAELLLRAAQTLPERKDRLGHLVAEEMGKILAEGK